MGKSEIPESGVHAGAALEPFVYTPWWPLLHTKPESQASKAGGRGKVNQIKDGHQLCVPRHEEGRLHEQTVDAQRI